MPLEPILASIANRFDRIRTGLVVGCDDRSVEDALKTLRGGVWMSVPATPELPFEDGQFEVVVLEGTAVTRENVREAHRVLRPSGCLFFTVNERTGGQDGLTAPEIYKIVREGYDIVALKRPKWWTFGRKGHTITVCARMKAWREHKGFIREGQLPFTPFRSRT